MKSCKLRRREPVAASQEVRYEMAVIADGASLRHSPPLGQGFGSRMPAGESRLIAAGDKVLVRHDAERQDVAILGHDQRRVYANAGAAIGSGH